MYKLVYIMNKGWFFTIERNMMTGPYRTKELAVSAVYEYIIYGIQEYAAIPIRKGDTPLLN